MTENELRINGKSFGETISQIEEFMESDDVHGELFTVLRSARDFMENLNEEIQQYRAIGTVEEFKALKEKSETLKALYENARKEGNNLIIKARAEAVNEFANYLHEKAKDSNGLRLSSETRSWTHPCIFDYLEEFKNEQTSKEET